MGRFHDAKTHFEDGIEYCRKARYRSELAWICCDYANTLILTHSRPMQSDEEYAVTLLDEGITIAKDFGMRPLQERLFALRDSIDRPASEYSNNLTEREAQVLGLIAQGKTNREIARELVLSERTIQRHVSNLYTKINVRNRVEATTYALTELKTSG